MEENHPSNDRIKIHPIARLQRARRKQGIAHPEPLDKIQQDSASSS
jgi:hypothetical protein